ncbi:hypothetical protein HYV79_02350 [Candidatus Woesearchaeota archaeon]|nr:hypothetical protein [Candidatus Woesearchaeota archaeon]
MLEKKVLVIDDEPDNVEALLDHFAKSNISYNFVSNIEDAVELLLDAHEHNTSYDLVILDNHFHFGKDDLIENGCVFDGIDLAVVLAGNESNFTQAHIDFINNYFGQIYNSLRSSYQGKIVLFSGSAAIMRENNPELFSGLEVVQKHPDKEGEFCEKELVYLISEMFGCLFDTPVSSIKKYKDNNNLADGLKNEEVLHEEAIRQFLEQAGVDPTQYL